jgi:hypothetical protein
MDEGPCQKVHSEPLKAEFQKSRDIHMFDSLIEREFTTRIAEAERAIKVRCRGLLVSVGRDLPFTFLCRKRELVWKRRRPMKRSIQRSTQIF